MDANVKDEIIKIVNDVKSAYKVRCVKEGRAQTQEELYKMCMVCFQNVLGDICAKFVISPYKEYTYVRPDIIDEIERLMGNK